MRHGDTDTTWEALEHAGATVIVREEDCVIELSSSRADPEEKLPAHPRNDEPTPRVPPPVPAILLPATLKQPMPKNVVFRVEGQGQQKRPAAALKVAPLPAPDDFNYADLQRRAAASSAAAQAAAAAGRDAWAKPENRKKQKVTLLEGLDHKVEPKKKKRTRKKVKTKDE